MSRCSSCQAPIIWARTIARGEVPSRGIPLDAEPVASGNIRVVGGDGVAHDGSVIEVAVSGLIDHDRPRYVSHFATCPDAQSWRKR